MKISEIQNKISTKTNHLIGTRVQKISQNTIYSSKDEYDEAISKEVTDISFEVSDRVISDIMKKINPKPTEFELFIDMGLYYNESIVDIRNCLPDGLEIDVEMVSENIEQLKVNKSELVHIKFNGFRTKDKGFIGTKTILNNGLFINKWSKLVVDTFKVVDMKNESIKNNISYGFIKAINAKNVMIDHARLCKTLEMASLVKLNGDYSDVEKLITSLDKVKI